MTSLLCPNRKIAVFQYNIVIITFFFEKKICFKYRNFTRLLAYKEENDIFDIKYKFQDHTSNIFFLKWRFLFSSGGNHPYPLVFDGLTQFRVRWYLHVCHQNDHLGGLYHFLFGLGAPEEISVGNGNHPLG